VVRFTVTFIFLTGPVGVVFKRVEMVVLRFECLTIILQLKSQFENVKDVSSVFGVLRVMFTHLNQSHFVLVFELEADVAVADSFEVKFDLLSRVF
jgi:hypothetical protein